MNSFRNLGYPNQPTAYLQHYFDKAYKVDTSGVVTTNQTGILSEYGDFFPTEPGPVALVTKSDFATSVACTSRVEVVALNVDANHDGIMDFGFGGPDYVADTKPYRFWVNDDDDDRDLDGGDVSLKPSLFGPKLNGLDDDQKRENAQAIASDDAVAINQLLDQRINRVRPDSKPDADPPR